MLNVLFIESPFTLKTDEAEKYSLGNGYSPRGILVWRNQSFTQFDYPTVCLVNGEPWLQARWDEVVPDGATVSFVRLAGEPTTIAIVIAVVAVVAAAAVALVIQPQNPAAIGAGDKDGAQNGATVYSLSGERNQNRLNNAIEAVYGKNRLWPAYAAVPYSTYDGNQQYQYSLFCLGHGYFTIHKMQFEDTPIQGFDDIEFEIVNPGETFDLFHDNVYTSSEVSRIELFGKNEPEFSGPTSAFVANAPFTRAVRLEVDVTLPAGLYELDEDGDPDYEEVTVNFQYQKINDEGDPIGPWLPLTFTQRTVQTTVPANDEDSERDNGGSGVTVGQRTVYTEQSIPYFYKRLKTLTPQRFTLGTKVAPGRYQVRAVRGDNKNTAANAGNTVHWETLRAYFPSVETYGNVTLVAIKARASNNLNNNAGQRFNVIATRKLKKWSPTGGWTANTVATRNPIWAFCDVFMARYGGRLSADVLDLEELYALAQTYELSRTYFDYIFDQRTTVWEAARAVCRIGRGIPILNGSQITIVRDRIKTTAAAGFNQHNIVAGSLKWSVKLRNLDDTDGVEVQYMDSDTWQMETVLCLIGDDQGDNPEVIKLPGCSSRAIAYHEGLYHRANQIYSKETIEFKTGLEGHLPRYGDLILVSHDVPKWGTGGVVLSIAGNILRLNEPVTFTPGISHKLILRKKDGSAYGPITVTPGEDEYHVVASVPITEDFYFDNTHERPFFLFGEPSLEAKRCTVVGVNPESEDVVEIRAVAYDDRIFSFDNAPVPDKYAPPARVQEPERPVVVGLKVVYVPGVNELVRISWQPALGARRYVIHESVDGVNYVPIATSFIGTTLEHRVKRGHLWIRVAGVGVAIGPWAEWNGQVGNVTALPITVPNLRLVDLRPGSCTIAWDVTTRADSYDVYVFQNNNGKLMRYRNTYGLTFQYTLDMGDIDGATDRTFKFRLRGVNIRGVSSDAAVLIVTIPDRIAEFDSVTADETNVTADATLPKADHS